MNISKILNYERLKRGMTQKEFSEFTGINRATLGHHLTGRLPNPRAIKIYSDKLDIDIAKIIINDMEK